MGDGGNAIPATMTGLETQDVTGILTASDPRTPRTMRRDASLASVMEKVKAFKVDDPGLGTVLEGLKAHAEADRAFSRMSVKAGVKENVFSQDEAYALEAVGRDALQRRNYETILFPPLLLTTAQIKKAYAKECASISEESAGDRPEQHASSTSTSSSRWSGVQDLPILRTCDNFAVEVAARRLKLATTGQSSRHEMSVEPSEFLKRHLQEIQPKKRSKRRPKRKIVRPSKNPQQEPQAGQVQQKPTMVMESYIKMTTVDDKASVVLLPTLSKKPLKAAFIMQKSASMPVLHAVVTESKHDQDDDRTADKIIDNDAEEEDVTTPLSSRPEIRPEVKENIRRKMVLCESMCHETRVRKTVPSRVKAVTKRRPPIDPVEWAKAGKNPFGPHYSVREVLEFGGSSTHTKMESDLSGDIDTDEWMKIMTAFMPKAQDADVAVVKDLFATVDANEDGLISLNELLHIVVLFSHPIPHSAQPGYGPVHVSPDALPLADHTLTQWENFKRGMAISGDANYLGTRTRDASGKAAAYTWITYNQTHERAQRIATGLQTHLRVRRQENVGVISKNRTEWVLTEIACNRMSYVLVPLYDTLGPKAIPYIVNHSDMRVLVCAGELIANVLDVKHECPTLEFLVSMDVVTPRERADAQAKGVTLLTLDDLEGVPDATVPEDPPHPSDYATICYTSGTTGDPKGAILTHRNLSTATECVTHRIDSKSYWVHLSYLPLAHVYERVNAANVTRAGGSMGFYQGDILHLMDDMAELKPHIFVSVPRLFNRVYDKIVQGVTSAGGVKKLMFDYAYASKKQGLADGTNVHALWDALVFSKIQAVLGGRVELIVSGSAPLSANVKEFLKIAFSYGLTETSATATLSIPDIPVGAHVGMPQPNVQIRLADVPDMNYTSADLPRPRGEICIRGNNVFLGYYKDAKKSAEVLSADGWFSTGDIGAWNADGTLSIIDRKKNIFKLAQGEYVAAEKIENIYAKSPFVGQIFLYGDSYQSYLVAVVVPDPEVVQAWAAERKLPDGTNLAAMAARPDLKAAILASMAEVANDAKLNGFECVKDIHVHPDVFTVEHD
ncbi:hypothetical protein DYB28_004852, partial [Aphanomyces astaci]